MNIVKILITIAALSGLFKSGYEFIFYEQSIVLSGYFQTSVLFIILLTLLEKNLKKAEPLNERG
ncbi:hypothetical protein GCM10009111_34770 [Colwellia asteriadis]|uniref:Uncharacterized protein n=1 Tax=Colwellia asteriadis TaxID=517723 RepID=A0ABP3WM94_9GAMM